MILYTVQIIALFAEVIFYSLKDKKRILIWSFILNILSLTVMILAKETDGWANTLAVCIRSTVYLFRYKYKTNLAYWLCLFLHLSAFILSYQNAWSILLGCATITICTVQWWGSTKQIKYGTLFSDICWTIYSVYVGLYLDLPKRFLGIILLLVSLKSLKKGDKQQ